MNQPTMLIGCPIWRREWALPHWFIHIEAAASEAGIEPGYIFVSDPRDLASQEVIQHHAEMFNRSVWQIWVEEPLHEDVRDWSDERIMRVAYLRNLLLRGIREIGPEFFLSIDSDVFLHPDAIVNMADHLDTFDAIGGKTFLSPEGTNVPNYLHFDQDGEVVRQDAHTIFAVDAISALILMTPRAYNIDCDYHPLGAEVGWSLAAAAEGVKLGWDGRATSKHVMDRELLDRVDERCGY